MEDLFGDYLFTVFEEERSPSRSEFFLAAMERQEAAAEKEKDGKSQAAAPAIKQEASSIDGPEECILGKKLKLETSAVDEIKEKDGKSQAAAPAIKREASGIDGPEECIFGKKLKLETSAVDEIKEEGGTQ